MQLFYNNLFPFKSKGKSSKQYTATLGIGGNIGDVQKRFKKLLLALYSDYRFHTIKTSPLLQNPPFGYLEQDDFLNAIIVLKTNLSPFMLLKQMQRYENRFGRKRSFKDAPRTLDIDIIFMEKNKKPIFIKSDKLNIPHLHWKNRESVMIPLNLLPK